MVTRIFIAIAAILHLGFMVLEMYFWTGAQGGRKILGMTHDQGEASVSLAMNQGLYNGFLAVGMGYVLSRQRRAEPIGVFCLLCGVVAGVFGACTTEIWQFLVVQSLPSALALVSWYYCPLTAREAGPNPQPPHAMEPESPIQGPESPIQGPESPIQGPAADPVHP